MSGCTVQLEMPAGLDLPDSGGWQAVRCPFHDDRRASGSINPDKGFYRCHGCGVNGWYRESSSPREPKPQRSRLASRKGSERRERVRAAYRR